MEKTITFVDAQQMKKENPESFYAPEQEDLDNLKVDDSVKVCVDEWLERFWVTVKEINGDEIIGIIDNDLLTDEAKYGDEIKFEKRHIYNIF